LDRLAEEMELWRTQFQNSLQQWRAGASAEWDESAQTLRHDLQELRPLAMAKAWDNWRDHLSNLNQDGHLLREECLQQLGPTSLACLNSVCLQVERLATAPDQIGMAGTTLFSELRLLERWAEENGVFGECYQELRLWVENLALGLLSRLVPSAASTRARVVELWSKVVEEHERLHAQQALSTPTLSSRWNSWILLLELCEHETQDYGPIADSLDALDADVDEIFERLGEQSEVAEVVAEYRDTSEALREALAQGKKLKGWSQIMPPLLVELDRLVPREPEEQQAPVSRVRSLCQRFESGALSVEAFQKGLTEFSASLQESRRSSRIQTAQHPSEVAFVEALGKLQSGLEILLSVDRAGQASRLEMGCTLIEDGLGQIQRLEAG